MILRSTVGDDGVGWGASTKAGCAENGTNSCTKAHGQNNILFRLSLYTILPSPILYDVCHKGGGGAAYIAQWPCTSIAIG